MQLTPVILVIAMTLVKSIDGRHKVILSQDYDKYEKPPTDDNTAVQVKASVNLRNIIKVDDKRQTITLEITMRLYWNDSRVMMVKDKMMKNETTGDCIPRDKGNGNLCYVEKSREEVDMFWLPDLFVDEAIEVRHPFYKIPTESVYVYENRSMRLSKRINFDTVCRMDFKKYPVDKQICPIKFESYGNLGQEMFFEFIGNPDQNEEIALPEFDFELEADIRYYTTYYKQHFPGIQMIIHLTRKLENHFVETYLPSILYVCIAFFALVVSPEFLQVRVAIGMFTLLTLTNMRNQVKSQVPEVSYLSYMDIWLFICLIFVFSTIVVTIGIAVLQKLDKKAWVKKTYFWTRVIFPILFLIFSVSYMTVILVEFNKEHDTHYHFQVE